MPCKFGNCRERSLYNFKSQQPRWCRTHKEEGMITNPASFCEHGIRRSRCKPCGGSEICEHGIQRSTCKPCGGGAICEHGIIRSRCFQCSPESNYFCIRRYPPSSFGSLSGTRCPQKKQRKYKNYCTRCYVELFPDDDLSKLAHLASKELNCKKFLDSRFPSLFVHNKRLILTEKDKTAHDRRIDFQSSIKKTVLGLEVDEHQHKWGYDPKDEEKRIMQIYENADRNLVFIRFNPDKYKEKGKWRRTPISKRYIALAKKIEEIIEKIERGEFTEWFTEIKMYFDD